MKLLQRTKETPIKKNNEGNLTGDDEEKIEKTGEKFKRRNKE